MLLWQNRRRTQNHSLIAAHDTFKNGSHRHFRLSKSNVPAKKHVHRCGLFHSLLDDGNSILLIFCFDIREWIFKFNLFCRIRRKGNTLCQFTLRVHVQKLFSQFLNGFFRLWADFFPVGSAHGMKARRFSFRTDILLQSTNLVYRKIKLIRSCILDGNVIPVDTG